ncbi:MAG: translocation/assembly module TamB domain-containing protein [Bacteroidota bacterium]
MYKEFEFNLRLTSKNFQLLNTTAESQQLYYGLLKVNTDTKITGNVNEPVITMTLSPSSDSNVTYVVPQSEKTLLEQKGIVQFVDKDFEGDPFLATLHLEDTVKTNNPFKGIDLTANIELNDKAVLNIIIDPLTGDKLAVQGSSTLTLQVNPTGDINLSGRYEITKGSYDFSFYKLVKRQFIIEKGGSISWSGDPMKAALDIQASYTVETSPLELISNQLSDQSEINSYKQVLPFLVYLNIRGQLLTPEITFKLDMPDSKRGAFGGAIYSKLQDINTRESDLNKQVFALLILKRFIADNPLENQAAAGMATTARQSVGRILSDQLNRLGENVKGVQLNVDIKSYEDYAAGTAQAQTRVQLGVQKTLLNDRLIIKLSGNVDIEGQNTNANMTPRITSVTSPLNTNSPRTEGCASPGSVIPTMT